MQNRNLAIAITVVTALCCGCFALMSCIWGVMGLAGAPINVDVGGSQSVEYMPMPLALGLMCLSIIFIAIPIVVGFLTLRQKPAAAAPAVIDQTPPPPTA